MTPTRNSGASQSDGRNVNKRKNSIVPIVTEQDKSEIRALLDLKNKLIETLERHNALLDNKTLSATTKKSIADDNNKLIERLKEAVEPVLPNEKELSAQMKSLEKAMKSLQEDMKLVKRGVKQNGERDKEYPALPTAPSLEDRLVVIEPGEKTYSDVTNTLKDCKLTGDNLRIDNLYTTKSRQDSNERGARQADRELPSGGPEREECERQAAPNRPKTTAARQRYQRSD